METKKKERERERKKNTKMQNLFGIIDSNHQITLYYNFNHVDHEKSCGIEKKTKMILEIMIT